MTNNPVCGRRGRLGALAALLLAAGVMAVGASGPAAAQTSRPLSSGCTELNDARFDGRYLFVAVASLTFFAGERVSVTAGPPVENAPTAVLIKAPWDTVVATAAFPGTATYTFATDTTTDILWGTEPFEDVAWTVGCDRPVKAPTCTRTITGDHVGSFTVGAGQVLCLTNARVLGSVSVNPGGALIVAASSVTEGIGAANAAYVSVCGSHVKVGPNQGAAVNVLGSTGPVRFGDPAAGCEGNRVTGILLLTNNTAGVTVGGNTATIGIACRGNVPAPTNNGRPNTAPEKTGQCVGL